MADFDQSSKQTVKKPRIFQPDDLGENNPFIQGNYDDEVELKFDEGKTLFVSKGFLSVSSPVFARMFQSGFKESNSSSVDLKEKNYEAFLEMLLFLHPRLQKTFSDSNAMPIYQIAHEYQIPTVLKRAENVLLHQITSQHCKAMNEIFAGPREQQIAIYLRKVFEMLNFADSYNNKALLGAAAERISVLPMMKFTNYSSYKDIPESTKITILQYRLKRLDKDEILNDKVNM